MNAHPTAAEAIQAVLDTGERLARAVDAVVRLEDDRSLVKSEAVRRLMATENTETGKTHSASSAEKIVEQDTEYAAYRKAQREAEIEKYRAWAAYEAAKLIAQLTVALVGAKVAA